MNFNFYIIKLIFWKYTLMGNCTGSNRGDLENDLGNK